MTFLVVVKNKFQKKILHLIGVISTMPHSPFIQFHQYTPFPSGHKTNNMYEECGVNTNRV